MARRRSNDTDVFADLYKKIDNLQDQITRLRNNRNMTLPVYDKSDLPPALLDPEMFWGTDNTLNVYHNGTVYTI